MAGRILLAWLLIAVGLIGLAPDTATAQTTTFRIVVDRPDFATTTVNGRLTGVPSGATSATVTITLADGSTRSTTTNAAADWQFRFRDTYLNAPWLQLSALLSTGAGASLPNEWRANQAHNYAAEITPPMPSYSYPPGFPGIWNGYYGPAYGFFYAYGGGLPPVYGPAPGYHYGAGYALPAGGYGFAGYRTWCYGWFPF